MTLKTKLGLGLSSVVLIVLCLFTSATLQLRHDALVREQAEQQLLMSLSLMVEPFLTQNKVEQVKAHLLTASFSSTLPLKAILVYQADGNLFSATQFPRELFNFSPSRDLTGRKALQDGSMLLWSAVMVTPANISSFEGNKAAPEGATLGYVAIQISPLSLSELWLWQSLLWCITLIILVVVGLIWQRRIFTTQRQSWQTFLEQICTLLPTATTETKQPAEFDGVELNHLYRELQAQYQHLEQKLQQQSLLGETQGQKSESELEQLESGHHHQVTTLTDALTTYQNQLYQWQQLCVLGEQGQVEQQAKLLNWLQSQYRLDRLELQTTTVWFPQWLAAQVAAWQKELQLETVSLVLVEEPALSFCDVQFCTEHAALVLKQIVSLIAEDLHQNELSLQVSLLDFSDNTLLLQFDHAGQSKAIQQVMSGNEPDAVLQQLCAGLLKRLGARLIVSALDDLGCSVRVELPLSAVSSKDLPMYQTVVYLDSNPVRAAVQKKSLYSLAEQVIYVQHPELLQQELQHRLVDFLLVQLPSPQMADGRWHELPQQVGRTRILALSDQASLPYWTEQLDCPVLATPLLSAVVRQRISELVVQQRVRLLVVDDNQTNLAFVKAILNQQQIDVDTASTGTEAIRQAKSNRYQLILMDIQLPDMSGILATHMIRQLPQHQDTVIMAFTAHAMPEEIEQFHQAGMNDVVIKPLDVHKAADLIRRCRQIKHQNPVQG